MADNKSKRFSDSPTDAGASGAEGEESTAMKTRHYQGSGSGDKWNAGEGESGAFEEFVDDDAASNSGGSGSKEVGRALADTGRQMKETAIDAGQRVKETALNVANETQQTLGDVAQDAKQKAESVVSQQKEMVADRVSTFANTLRETGRQLQEGDEATIGEYAQNVAGQLDRFAGYLQRNDMNALIGEVRTLARRQPEIFLAGSLAVGFLVGRFLKSSAGGYGGSGYGGSSYSGSSYRSYSAPEYGSRGYSSQGYGSQGYGSQGYGPQGDGSSGYGSQNYRSQGYGSQPGSDYGRPEGSSYPDLMYRDTMRGDAPMREEIYTGNPGYSGTQAGGISSSRTDAATQGLVTNADDTVESGGSGYDDTSANGAMDSSLGSTRGSQAT